MLRSMTGYGKHSFSVDGFSILIEIRALNSKQLDLNTRIAPLFREKESEIRMIISNKLNRGKVDLSISIEKRESCHVIINTDLAKQYTQLFAEIAESCNLPLSSDLLVQAVKMPEVTLSPKDEVSERLWGELFAGVEKACLAVDNFRASEGVALEGDIRSRINLIHAFVDEITPFEEQRMETLRAKFESNLSEINIEFDKNRLEEELIYYIEKIDITEEKVRLLKHCNYFIETMQSSEDSPGKKLGFILQEIGREINTLGSKAYNFQIQQVVVNMKDEMEKVKEQLSNIL